MENIIHFIKHILGLCGEPHPNILYGGLFAYCGYCFHLLLQKIKRR